MLSRPLDIAQIALICVLGYADFRFADCGWRKAYPKLDAFHEKMLDPALGQDLGAAAGVTPGVAMSLKLSVGDLTIHRIIEQETSLPAGAGDAARPDAGPAGGKPAVDAGGWRARRRRTC